ncbi:MAG: tyrosine-type recombinase/integrase [Roseibium sp.]
MKQAKVLTKAELKRVLTLCETAQNGDRNRIALLLSHHAGLRVGEIATLVWADIVDRDRRVKTV